MGIELPPELTDVAAQAGVQWPEADEEVMARSAQAWREAATSMSTVTTDADTTVRGALDSVRGDTGTAATQHWQTFVEPDSGHLTSTVRGMNDAADRLEHASQQVGAAKVEIVRNLVSLAQNSDAAHNAASAGHPMALAGLDTAIQGTSANVANIESNLISAVQPASGVDMSTVRDPVNANPGTHAPNLLSTVTDTVTDRVADTAAVVDDTTRGATDLVANTTQGATNLVADTASGATNLVDNTAANVVGDGGRGPGGPGLVADTVHGATNLVDDTAANVVGDGGRGPGGPGLVADTVHGATNLVGDGRPDGPGLVPGATDVVGDTARGTVDVVGDTAHGAANVVGGPGGDPDITGPVPIGGDDQPTPPTGQTVQAGLAGVDVAPSSAANLPPNAPVAGGTPGPGGNPNVGGPNFGGAPPAPAPGGAVGGPIPGGAPGAAGPGAGARPISGAPAVGGAVPGGPAAPGPRAPLGAPGAPGTGGPVAGGPRIGAPGAPFGAAPGALGPAPVGPGAGARPADALLPEPRKGGYGGVAPPVPPAPPAAMAAPAKARDETLALFWVHMFPIGHMPVAAVRPARQLPAPPAELDYAAGLRFEPGDHPRAELVDSAERRAALREGVEPLEATDPLPADAPPVAALKEGHDPLGGENERDWDRRYLVRFGSVTAHGISREGVEFAWPPGEQYPEGGSAEGEAEVLDEGTELDRFGRVEGRVFAAADTPFAQRSLPPAHLEDGYRRFRVLRPLPVWRAVSAAWFAQPGGGVRFRTTHSALELVALGYLADVTHEEAAE